MQGQHYFFRKSNQVKVDQSVYDRYLNETYRIYGVLEKQLETHEWIGLDRFTIAGTCFEITFDKWLTDIVLHRYGKLSL